MLRPSIGSHTYWFLSRSRGQRWFPERPESAGDIRGVAAVEHVRARWVGHQIYSEVGVVLAGAPTAAESHRTVAAAAVIGFLGNETVALFQIRTGNRIGSPSLVADGMHVRIDGLTSLVASASSGSSPSKLGPALPD